MSAKESTYCDPKEHPLSETSVNKYDPYSLKGALDDEIIAFLESKDFVEATSSIDIKIVIYAVACVLGYLSHFKTPFPA